MLKNKKFIVLMLSLLILAQSSTVFAVSFTDVRKDNNSGWAYDYIMELAEKGVVKGYPDGTYKPDNYVLFVETLELLNGVINPSETEKTNALAKHSALIKSVETPVWAEKTMAVALERGIVSETELRQLSRDNMIKENTTVYIPRYTVAQLMARALKLTARNTNNLAYDDISEIPSEGRGLIAALVDTGILHREGRDGKFLPKANIKRSEMAKMIKVAYDWVKANPLEDNLPEVTETGTVVSYLSTTRNFLVYQTRPGTTVSAVVNANTKVVDKDNKVVSLNDMSKFETANVTVVYKMVNNERIATSIKFTTDGQPQSGDFTFVSYRTANNKNYIKVKDANNNERELEIKNNFVKSGNLNLLLNDVRKDSVLTLKIEGGIVTEATLKTAQTGKYTVVNTNFSGTRKTITVAPVNGGKPEEYTLYDNYKVYVGNTETSLNNVRVGNTVDLNFTLNYVDRITIYTTGQTGVTYTYNETLGNGDLVLSRNNDKKGYRVATNVKLYNLNRLTDLIPNRDVLEVEFDKNNSNLITSIKRISSGNQNFDVYEYSKINNMILAKRNSDSSSIYYNVRNVYIDNTLSTIDRLPIKGFTRLTILDSNTVDVYYSSTNNNYSANGTIVNVDVNNRTIRIDVSGQNYNYRFSNTFDVIDYQVGNLVNVNIYNGEVVSVTKR